MEENNLNVTPSTKPKSNIGIIILLVLIIIGLTGFIVYQNFIKEDNEKKENNQPVTTPTPIPSANPTPVPSSTTNDSDSEFDIEIGKSINKNIKLGDKTIKLEAGRISELEKEDDIWGNGIAFDEKVVYEVEYPEHQKIIHVSIIKDEVLMVVSEADYIDSTNIVFIDNNGNIIKDNLKLEEDGNMPITSRINNEGGVEVKDNKIIIYGSRKTYLDGLICDYSVKNGIRKTSYNEEYDGKIYEAIYEIEYLGNNQFSKVKRVEVLQTIDESLCE